jgi:hypothetical protein
VPATVLLALGAAVLPPETVRFAVPFGLAVVAFAAGATSPAAAATDVAIVAVSASGRRKAESDMWMAPWPVVSTALRPAWAPPECAGMPQR